MIHLYFNLIGTIVFMIVFYFINAFVNFAFLSESANAAGIALIHSLFNIGATICWYPFSDGLVKLAEITISGDDKKEKVEEDTVSIDERFIERPAFAMEVCRTKSREMAELAQKAIKLATKTLLDYDSDTIKEVIRLEALVDQYEDMLGAYLVKLSSKNISVEDSLSMSVILHSISDFERISDHALNLAQLSKKINKKELSFSKSARREIVAICNAVDDICSLAVSGFCNDDSEKASHVEPLEEVIDTLTKTIKKNHINRLKKGKCGIEMGFILEDILTDLERVSDHCSNIALELITIHNNDYNTHGYFKNFSDKERDSFYNEYEELLKKYPLTKKEIKKLEKEKQEQQDGVNLYN